MLLRLIGAYICLGVIVECVEELIIVKNCEKWFGVPTAVDGPFGIGGGYNWKFYIREIKDILTWPIGIVPLIVGIRAVRRKSQEEIVRILGEYNEKYRK